MMHTEKDGTSKIVQDCDLPLTALNAVDVLITDLAVFRFIKGQLTLTEIMPGSTLEEVRRKTAAIFKEDISG